VHQYSENQKWHDGKLEAVLNLKSWGPGTIPNESAIVLDVEKGQSRELRAHPWQTDTSLIAPWFYAPGKMYFWIQSHRLR
jgi:alpha-L-fucosidase